ncbi:hypothetical protein [Methylobacterium sp. WSM2598]|uniref:hypothetical protein n=1 Tax=Methylobacterium sp. WSM2598 TaxID=398261 RepID=UPI001F336DD3|nr:hypothetical protein [Methylobacterium sp. WSM2598]
MDHVDPRRGDSRLARARHHLYHLVEPEVGRGRGPPVDGDRHVRRVGDAQIVDHDAAEGPDRADDAGAADAAVPSSSPGRVPVPPMP